MLTCHWPVIVLFDLKDTDVSQIMRYIVISLELLDILNHFYMCLQFDDNVECVEEERINNNLYE